MAPIITIFLSMLSLMALVADRSVQQEQVTPQPVNQPARWPGDRSRSLTKVNDLVLFQAGESIPLPPLDDGVSRNFLDVAKRTVPFKFTPPQRAVTFRRIPRAAPAPAPTVPVSLLDSLLVRALRKRDIRDQLWGRASPTTK